MIVLLISRTVGVPNDNGGGRIRDRGRKLRSILLQRILAFRCHFGAIECKQRGGGDNKALHNSGRLAHNDLYRRVHMPIDVVISPEREVAEAAMPRLVALPWKLSRKLVSQMS